MSAPPRQSTRNGLAIAAFVFGLIALPLAIFPFGMFPGPIAIVLGLLARRSPNLGVGNLRFARAGILFGVVGSIIWLVIYGLLAIIAS
ncbi:MAG: hypothetical protein H0V47_10180 [Chloroflexia bacterium]|jgi:hypothetical protein|nr:hypothetical protein [Chloroflexia bacterium]